MVHSDRARSRVITEVIKHIQNEMKAICSDKHDSILRDSIDGIKQFSWNTVWVEMITKMPTLMKLLSGLLPSSSSLDVEKPFLCLIS